MGCGGDAGGLRAGVSGPEGLSEERREARPDDLVDHEPPKPRPRERRGLELHGDGGRHRLSSFANCPRDHREGEGGVPLLVVGHPSEDRPQLIVVRGGGFFTKCVRQL